MTSRASPSHACMAGQVTIRWMLCLIFAANLLGTIWADEDKKKEDENKVHVPKAQILVVIDRGIAAKDDAKEHLARARAFVDPLIALGMRAKAVAVTSTSDNLAQLREIAFDDKGLASIEESQYFDFKRPTGVGIALGVARRRRGKSLAQWLVLVGPFTTAGQSKNDRKELEAGVEKWNEDAPKGTKIIAFGLSDDARAVLENEDAPARGWQPAGRIVTEVGSPQVTCDPPASLMGTSRSDIRGLLANVSVATSSVTWGDRPPPIPISIATNRDGDKLRTTIDPDTGMINAQITRDDMAATELSVSVTRDEEQTTERVLFFGQLPDSVEASWPEPKREAVLQRADGSAPTAFQATGVTSASPATADYVIAYTDIPSDTGERAPTWHVGNQLKAGMKVKLGSPKLLRPGVRGLPLTVSYHPKRGYMGASRGVISLVTKSEYKGTLSISYACAPADPRARLVLIGGATPQLLPQGDAPEEINLVVRDLNSMTPDFIQLRATVSPEAWKPHVAFTAMSEAKRARPIAWDRGTKLSRDIRYALSARLKNAKALPDLSGSAEVTVTAMYPSGISIDGTVTFSIGLRSPRIVVEPNHAAYDVAEGKLTGIHAIRLSLDPDGITGDALLRLMEISPTVTATPRTLQDWTLRLLSPGKWQLEPSGAWKGAKPDSFSARNETASFSFAWRGQDVDESATATVSTPAKVKSTGWLFLGLGALAALLGLVTVMQFRPPPVKGTLLYTVDGVDRAVGRLPLDSIGRRKATLHATKRGKLSIGGAGETVATIQPTRVGPMIVSRSESGSRDRRLLVDGLAIRTGRHTLRYVSGAPNEDEATSRMADIPDLFGDDFDIETGKVDEAWRKATSSQAGESPALLDE